MLITWAWSCPIGVWKYSALNLVETWLVGFATLVQYSDKFMHSIVKFLIVLLHSLLLCFCTVLLCEVNTIQCHA